MFTVLIPHRLQNTCGWFKAAVSCGYLTPLKYRKKTKNQKPQQG